MADEPTSPDSSSPADGAGFDQTDIDALFGEVSAAAGSAAAVATVAPATDDGTFDQSDIDALLGNATGSAGSAPSKADSANSSPPPDARLDSMGRPIDEMAAAMQAAIEEERAAKAEPVEQNNFELTEFAGAADGSDAHRITMLSDVNLRVRVELGRTRMLVEDVLRLVEGSVVELDKLAGDPVDVFVNDRLLARGEVLVLNDSFCVRINEVLTNDPHRIEE